MLKPEYLIFPSCGPLNLNDPTLVRVVQHNLAFGGSYAVRYRGGTVLIPLVDIHEGVGWLLTEPDKPALLTSVRRALQLCWPLVKAGTAPLEMAIECGQDISVLVANEMLEGRAPAPGEFRVQPPG